MSNTTDEYWEIDGVSLQTYAFNVETIGEKFSTPKFRGEDRQYAYKAGAAHRPRTADSGGVQLGMWVVGMREDGSLPASRKMQFGSNLKKLRQLVWKPDGEEFTITKRWWDLDGLHVATGKGMVPDGIKTAMEGGPYRGKIVIDVHMADPFFYGPAVDVTIAKGATVVVANPGDNSTTRISVAFNGQLTNPLLTNTTPNPDVWLKLGTAVAVGDKVTADIDECTVRRTSDGANLIGAVQHSGARAWFGLQKGNNSVQLSADAGSGNAVLTYQPVYF